MKMSCFVFSLIFEEVAKDVQSCKIGFFFEWLSMRQEMAHSGVNLK